MPNKIKYSPLSDKEITDMVKVLRYLNILDTSFYIRIVKDWDETIDELSFIESSVYWYMPPSMTFWKI